MKLTKWLLALVALASLAACGNDTEQPRDEYGYVQFRLLKNGASAQTRADVLDYLGDADKIKVTLRTEENDIIVQTMTLDSQSPALAEFGVQSDKFQLLVDTYNIMSYELYDVLDNLLLSATPATPTSFSIVPSGLVVQDLTVAVTGRGFVEFNLRSEMSGALNDEVEGLHTRVATTPTKKPFHLIVGADIEITSVDLFPQETQKIEGLDVVHQGQMEEDNVGYYISRCISDSLVSVKAGTWRVTSFTVYYDEDDASDFESSVVVDAPEFTVGDNATVTTDVFVTMSEVAGNIRDGIALKKIWEALDGPNWKKNKWDFNRDVDLWVLQPGVSINPNNGRVSVLDLTEMEAKGDMPAAIGDLTELEELYLGWHGFVPNSSTIRPDDPTDMALPDVTEDMNLSNFITSIPKEINNLKKLMSIYVGFSAIKTIPADLSGLVSLENLEFFYCPELKEFPAGIATLPRLVTLIFSNNWSVPTEKMYEGLVALNAGVAGKTVQGINIPDQSLGRVPDLTAMTKLNSLDIQNCDVTEFEAPFGKDILIRILNAANNKISSLPRDAEGYFIGEGDAETFNFANNSFTQLPDIFYRVSFQNIDFSGNLISSVENGGDPETATFRPVSTDIFSLANNKFTRFPKEILHKGSTVLNFYFQGNSVEEMDEDTFDVAKAKNVPYIRQITLSYNKFAKLPESFNGDNLRVLRMLDLSGNRFAEIPRNVASIRSMEVLSFRDQRDENGNRCMKTWPTGIWTHPGLYRVFLGSNDIGEVNDDRIFNKIYEVEIADNPNISLTLNETECMGLTQGMFFLRYDPSQDIRGCDALRLD
jgi:Leucine-rich repeat (LRR) protein